MSTKISNEVKLDISNPLLQDYGTPKWDEITVEKIDAAMSQLIPYLEGELTILEQSAAEKDFQPKWENLMQPIANIYDRIAYTWQQISHLKHVKDTEPLRELIKKIEPEKVKFGLRLAQSQALYQAQLKLQQSAEFNKLERGQQRIIEQSLLDAKLAGVGLEGEKKERFNSIQEELSKLSTEFSNNLLDATKSWALLLTDPAEMRGLPKSYFAQTAQAAKQGAAAPKSAEKFSAEQLELMKVATEESGPWLITLDAPGYIPFMTYADSRGRREQLYRAYLMRASSGSNDNSPVMAKLLKLKQEMAQLLGYSSYAEVSLATKLVKSVEQVDNFLEELRLAAYQHAVKDLEQLKQFAADQSKGEYSSIELWDQAYWAEKLKQAQYSYAEEDLRPYFQFPQVLKGLFDLVEKMYEVKIKESAQKVPVWHPDVRYFEVFDAQNQLKASFYVDAYSRPSEKQGGAWMDECVPRAKLENGKFRMPIAYLNCNQSPPVGNQPSLMTFQEVVTLFHEFGHVSQHILTAVDYSLAAGIRNVEWDAVELPSQFTENFCYHKDTIKGLSCHIDTAQSIPDELYNKIIAAKTFRSGSDTLRQLQFGSIDMALYSKLKIGQDEAVEETCRKIFELEAKVQEKTTVIKPLAGQRFLCGFAHIFSGGYSAGYYSYKWAECMSADAFSAFEEAGFAESPEKLLTMGRKFRDTVLALGGSVGAAEVYRLFRGRDPTTEALLRMDGLLTPPVTA
jgi:oligopeptidase A